MISSYLDIFHDDHVRYGVPNVDGTPPPIEEFTRFAASIKSN
jgi:hypothetical protein